MTRVTIVCFAGLPGSGKTSLATALTLGQPGVRRRGGESNDAASDCAGHSPLLYWRVSLDEAVARDMNEGSGAVAKQLATGEDARGGVSWKERRATVLHRLARLAMELCSNSDVMRVCRQFPELVAEGDIEEQLARRSSSEEISHVLLFDDNNYYRSMRYEVFRIAREFKAGFLQVFCVCDPSLCMQRVQGRPSSALDAVFPVAPGTVARMAPKLEFPGKYKSNPDELASVRLVKDWEQSSILVATADKSAEELRDRVELFVRASLSHPVDAAGHDDGVDSGHADESRQRTLCSLTHQLELALRKQVSGLMSEWARAGPVPSSLGRDLSQFKGAFLARVASEAAASGSELDAATAVGHIPTMCKQFADEATRRFLSPH